MASRIGVVALGVALAASCLCGCGGAPTGGPAATPAPAGSAGRAANTSLIACAVLRLATGSECCCLITG